MTRHQAAAHAATQPLSNPMASDRRIRFARSALSASAALWLSVTLAGQAVFAAYVAMFYGGATLAGQFERWNKVLPRGYSADDAFGNAILAMHLSFAVLWVLSGAIQLIPAIRRHAPALHRWNGRIYLGCSSALALGGLWLVWVRGGVVGDVGQHLAISINALLILGCGAKAWQAARSRRLTDHRRWALRLFVAASGVWFFRVGLMAWLALHRKPVGFDASTFQGPFLTLLALGAYVLLPLASLQMYFHAKDRGGPGIQLAAAVLMAGMTLVLCVGAVAATLGMWWPRMSS